jgi:predicted amidohydrolase
MAGMRVAVCQMRSGEDVAANLAEGERLLREAASQGAELALLPEVFTYLGRSEGRAAAAEPLPGGPAGEVLAAVARDAGMWVAAGIIERDGDHVFNTSPLFDRTGEMVARYRKIHLYDVALPGQPPFRESATFTPGEELVTHQTETARVGLSVCYDLRFPELYRGLMVLGAEVITVPSQFQFATGKDHWEVLLRARAIENQCFMVAADQWGTYGDPEMGRRSYGNSMVVDPWGRVLARAGDDGTQVLVADLDLAELRRVRSVLPVLQSRRLGLTC